MTQLGEERILLAKQLRGEFFGACQLPDSELILLAFDSEVVLMQPHDSRVIRSWTCPKNRGILFTDNAVFSPEDQEFVIVQDGIALRTFKESDFQLTETFTLKHRIHSVIGVHHCNPIVMLEDGSIFDLFQVMEDPKKIVPDSSLKMKVNSILFSDSFTDSNGKVSIYSICKTKNTYRTLISMLNPEEYKAEYHHTLLECEDCELLSASSPPDKETSNPVISTIWSDGSLRLIHIDLNQEGRIDVQIRKITNVEIGDNVSLSMLSSDQVAVSSKGKLSVIDLKFGSVLQQIDITSEVLKIFTIDDLILLETMTGVEKIQFSAKPITLASALFKSKDTPSISELQHADWDDSPTQTSLFNKKDADLIEVLMKTKQETNFDKSWMKFWKGRSEEFRKEFCRSNILKQILSRFGIEEEKKKFWPKSTISKIISTGLLSGRWCDGVFSQVLERKDWSLLLKCIQEIADIPEHTMAQCLTHLTRHDVGDLEKMESDSELSPEVQSCIDGILQLPYSENALRNELLLLPFKRVMVFLAYLTGLLEELSLASESPTLDQVICWISLIIDAHLSELVMLEDSWPLITRLQKAVELQSAIFTELTEVSKLLMKIQCKITNTRKTEPKSLYFVEIMRL